MNFHYHKMTIKVGTVSDDHYMVGGEGSKENKSTIYIYLSLMQQENKL